MNIKKFLKKCELLDAQNSVKNFDIKILAYFIFAVAVFVLLFSLLNFFLGQKIVQTNEIYTSVNVSDKVGFDLNKTALTFGEMQRPGKATRNLVVENSFSFAVVAEMSCEGDICSILEFEKFVKAEANESKKISFTIVTDPDTRNGFYEGKIKMQFRRRYTLW